VRPRALGLVALTCLAALSTTASAGVAGAAPPRPASPSGLVVALSLGDPAMQAGVVRGGEVVLARGFEVALAQALARRLGGRVDRFVEMRPAARLPAGAPAGWHLALAAIEPSRAARSAADLSVPYLTTDAAVVLRRGLTRPRRLAELRDLVVCAVRGTPASRVIGASIRPTRTAVLVHGEDQLRTLLRTGACDAAVVPAVEAGRFVRGHARELGPVAGRVASGDGLVVAVARGTGVEVATVDRALGRLRADGTLGRLARSWLGLDPARLRVLR
jgi:ABC-type amino acid transport substrate-binding protein